MDLKWHLEVVEIPITVTLDAYTAGDVVGGLLTSDTVKQFRGGGYVAWARLVDATGQAEPYYLYLYYDAPTTTIANDAAFAPVEADWLVMFTQISIPAANYDTTGADSAAFVVGKDRLATDFLLFPALPDGVLYGYLVCTDTPDYAAATDLTLHLGLMLL